jgi:hypothetical protein
MTCAVCGKRCRVASWAENDDEGNVTWKPDRLGRPFRWKVVPGTARRDYPGDMAEAYCSAECSLVAYKPEKYRRLPIVCPDGKVWTDEKGYDQ